jgi:hypothetical protein
MAQKHGVVEERLLRCIGVKVARMQPGAERRVLRKKALGVRAREESEQAVEGGTLEPAATSS